MNKAEDIDVGTGPVETEPVALVKRDETGLSLLDMDPKQAIALAERRAEQFSKVIGIVLKQRVGEECWIDQGGKPYLEGRGARQALQFLGLRQRDRKYEEYHDDQLDSKVCRCSFELVDNDDNVRWEGEGSRAYDDIVDSVHDRRKAAEKNAWHHAGDDVLGTGGMSWKQLEEFGIKPGTKIGYRKGQHGGTSTSDGIIRSGAFGRQPNTPIADLETGNLRFYLGAAERNMKDPKKAKFRAQDEAFIEAAEMELHARADQYGDGPPPAGWEPGQ